MQPDRESNTLPFVFKPTECGWCFRIGYRIAPQGGVERCPTLVMGEPHVDITPEGEAISRAIRRVNEIKLPPDPLHFDIARTIAKIGSTKSPCKSGDLIERHFSYVIGPENRRRLVTRNVQFLRDIWRLPLCSRKDAPAGYWISVDAEDFGQWVKTAANEPITRHATIRRVARANWPQFAEQMELDFVSELKEAA